MKREFPLPGKILRQPGDEEQITFLTGDAADILKELEGTL